MNCNCLEDVKTKLTDFAVTRGVVNPKLSPDFLGINLGNGESIISLAYTMRGENRPYNTAKGKPVTMVASHCPFCGKSVKAGEVAA